MVDYMFDFYVLGRIRLVLHHVDGLTIFFRGNYPLENCVIEVSLLEGNRLYGSYLGHRVNSRLIIAALHQALTSITC